MHKMDVQPSAPILEEEDHLQPPPNYEEAMGLRGPHGGYTPVLGQPGPHGPPSMPHTSHIYPSIPPPQMYPAVQPPQQFAGSQTVHHPQLVQESNTTVVVTSIVPVGPRPTKMRCPYCLKDIKTSTVTENKCSAHMACAILFVVGCCLCSCIPYCMDSCKVVKHTCPSCHANLGTYSG